MNTCKKIIALTLSVLLALALCACAKQTAPENTDPAAVKNGDTVGQGATSFAVEVRDAQGNATEFTVKTDEKTVGAALLKLNLIAGEQGQYGLYIKQVLGITADYEKDGTYWAFYIDGQYAPAGVDMTDIVPGSAYTFAVEKMQ